jgi:hypothetical protein
MHRRRFLWKRHVQGGALVYPKRSGKAISIPGLQNAPLKEKATEDLVDMMMGWRHSGFNVYCGPRIQPDEEEAIENLARYIIRASFSQKRMTYIPEESKVVYQSKYGKKAQVRGHAW